MKSESSERKNKSSKKQKKNIKKHKKSRSRSRSKSEKKKKIYQDSKNKDQKEQIPSEQDQPIQSEPEKKQKVLESELIDALKEDPSYLAQKYNEIKEQEKVDKEKAEKNATLIKLSTSRTGGVYVPPHKLAKMQSDILQKEEKLGMEHQKLMWELLRKSINGIINKVKNKNIKKIEEY